MDGTILVLENKNNEIKKVIKQVELDSDGTIGWKPLSELLNGAFIEHVSYSDVLRDNKIDMWIDDCGKLENLDETILIFDGCKIVDMLVGNVIFTGCDNKGNTLPLSVEQVDIINKALILVNMVDVKVDDSYEHKIMYALEV